MEPCDNLIYGICYEHGRDTDMTFHSYEHVLKIVTDVDEGRKHVPTENMVIAISSNSEKSKGHVIAALPTCSKKEVEYQGKIIKTISSEFKKTNGAPLLNWSTIDSKQSLMT